MGHIYKTESDKWRAVIEIGNSRKRRRKTKTFTTKKEAEVWLSQQKTDQNDGYKLDPDDISFIDFANRWLEKHKKRTVAATTYKQYKARIKSHFKPFFKDIKLKDIEPVHIEEYFDRKRKFGNLNDGSSLSENTLKKHYVEMNLIFKRAIKLKIIKYNPMQAIEAPIPEKKKAPVMNKAEFNKLLAASRNDDLIFTFILTILLTGLRRSEALGLEWEDIDLDFGILHVRKRYVLVEGGQLHEEKTKTASSNRKIKMPEKLIEVLKQFKNNKRKNQLRLGKAFYKEKDFVFCKANGKPYNIKHYNDKFNEYLEAAALPGKYSIHTLRHTFATVNLKNDIEPKIIQEMLGHSTISTTLDIYSHVDLEMQNEAASKINDVVSFE